jgi:hypothetical protein
LSRHPHAFASGRPVSWIVDAFRSRVLRSNAANGGVCRLKKSLLVVVALLAGCSWFHRSKPMPDPPEIIVTGIAPGAFVYLDGVQVGDAQEKTYRSRIINVSAGTHVVEVKMGDTVTFHETAYSGPGDKRYVMVLSGNTRN